MSDLDLSVFDWVADLLDPPEDNWVPLPHQIPPAGRWFVWALMGGRGAGKTATAARYVHELVHGPPMVEGVPGGHWISIVGPTLGDAVQSCVLGPSGLRKWDSGIKVLTTTGGTICRWSNGVEAKLFGAHSPEDVERFRAGGNRTFVWAEELAAWRYMEEAWQQIRYGLRTGLHPHALVTTTPKPRSTIKDLFNKAKEQMEQPNPRYVMTHAPTSANPHLDPDVKQELYDDYEGTRLGRQELAGELLLDVENALWATAFIDGNRLGFSQGPSEAECEVVVVAVDPQAESGAAETGIVVCGRINGYKGDRRPHAFVFGDESIDGTPDVWATKAVRAYYDYGANYIVAEKNQGGEMVKHTINSIDPDVPVKVVSATRGKAIRAEPVALTYERGRVHHIGTFGELEDQMLQFDPFEPPEVSPDRMDALVWGITDLLIGAEIVTQSNLNDNRLRGRR